MFYATGPWTKFRQNDVMIKYVLAESIRAKYNQLRYPGNASPGMSSQTSQGHQEDI